MKEFCFHCGNKTLQKVSVTVNRDGSIEYFLSKRRPISTRGMKVCSSLPQFCFPVRLSFVLVSFL